MGTTQRSWPGSTTRTVDFTDMRESLSDVDEKAAGVREENSPNRGLLLVLARAGDVGLAAVHVRAALLGEIEDSSERNDWFGVDVLRGDEGRALAGDVPGLALGW